MQRKLDALLWELRKHGELILLFTEGQTFEQYTDDILVRSAVERQFIIMGEVMVRIRKHFPADFQHIDSPAQILDFRNQLVHLYDQMKDEEVWRIVTVRLPAMLEQITAMLGEQRP